MELKNMFKELRADLAGEAIAFGVLVIILVVVATIVQTIQGTQQSGTSAYNASVQGQAGIAQFTAWLVIIAIVIVATYLIFMVRKVGGSGPGTM